MDTGNSVDQFEKRKQRRTNENTSMNEEAKVGLENKAVSSQQNSREEIGSVKLWELDSGNRDV